MDSVLKQFFLPHLLHLILEMSSLGGEDDVPVGMPTVLTLTHEFLPHALVVGT